MALKSEVLLARKVVQRLEAAMVLKLELDLAVVWDLEETELALSKVAPLHGWNLCRLPHAIQALVAPPPFVLDLPWTAAHTAPR